MYKLIFLFFLCCAWNVLAQKPGKKIDLRDIFSSFENEETQTTSLSDKAVAYTVFQENQTEDQSAVSYDTPYLLLFDALKLHDTLVGLYEYKDHCDELDKADNLINQTQTHLTEIEAMNERLLTADKINNASWDDLKTDYFQKDTKVKTLVNYLDRAPALTASHSEKMSSYYETQATYNANIADYEEKKADYEAKKTAYETLLAELESETNDELNEKQQQMNEAQSAFEEIQKTQEGLANTLQSLNEEIKGLEEQIVGLSDNVLNAYQEWGKAGNPFQTTLSKENLKNSGIMETWQAGLDVLKKYYDIKQYPALVIPDDVDFFKKALLSLTDETDKTKITELLLEPDVYIPVVERTKYVVDIVSGAAKNTAGAFYHIPKVWETTYPYFWRKYGCMIHKGNMFTPCDTTEPATIAELTAMMCSVIPLPINLRDKGEWDLYFSEPDITAKSKTVEEEKSEEVTDVNGDPVIDPTTGEPEIETWTDKQTENVCGGPASLSNLYHLKDTKMQYVFRNRFEDYAGRLMAVFRAIENKRYLQKLTETMRQTNIQTLQSFDVELADALTCSQLDGTISKVQSEKQDKLQKLNKHYQDYFDKKAPDWQKNLKKALQTSDFSRLFLTVSNIAITGDMAEEAKAIKSIPTATQIYLEEERKFVNDFNTFMGKALYRNAFQTLTSGGSS